MYWLGILSCAIALIACATSHPARSKPVPVSVLGHVLVQGTVAGYPSWLVLDPIAGVIVDQGWAARHGVPLVDGPAIGLAGPATVGGAGSARHEARFVRHAEVHVGSHRDTAHRVAIALDSLLSAAIGHRVDGLIGLAALGDHVVELSATDQRLVLHDRRNFQPPVGARPLAVRYDGGIRPLVPLALLLPDGRRLDALAYLDLGMSGSLRVTTRFVEVHDLVALACAPDRAAALDSSEVGLGGALSSIRTHLGVAWPGEAAVESLVVTLAREREGADARPAWDVLVGWSLMRSFDWWFDVTNDRLWFRRNPAAWRPEGSASGGLEFGPAVDGGRGPLVVAAASGPAAQAGILPGDTIQRVDGRRVAAAHSEWVRTTLSHGAGRDWAIEVRHGITRQITLRPVDRLRRNGCVS